MAWRKIPEIRKLHGSGNYKMEMCKMLYASWLNV